MNGGQKSDINNSELREKGGTKLHNYCLRCKSAIKQDAPLCINCGASVETPEQPSSLQDTLTNSNQQVKAKPYRSEQRIAEANSKGHLALVRAIFAMVFCWTGVLGIILAPIAISNATKSMQITWEEDNKSYYIALAGKIIGGIGLVMSIVFIFNWFILGCVYGVFSF